MVRVQFLLAAAICACRPPDLEAERPEESRHHPEHFPADLSESAGNPLLDTATVTDDDACLLAELTTNVEVSSTSAIRTQEDFDFDALGFLDTQRGYDLAGYTRTGARHYVAQHVSLDIAGIRSLATGDLVIATPQNGMLKRVNYDDGQTSTIIAGLLGPSGVEAGLDGLVYVSEYYHNGTVRAIDPYTGENEVVAELPYPNELALSHDDQTLYVATTGQWYGGVGTIAALDRGDDGAWDPQPRMVYQSESVIDAMAVDVCGNLYVAESWTGRVFRIRLSDGGIDHLADLDPGPYGLTAARFGHGIGDFDRTHLFITNLRRLYILDIGIEGRHVLAP